MLIFDPVAHSYKNQFTREIYISATSLINKFKKPFDVETVSKRVAEKEGVTQAEVKAKWKKINDDSKVYGQKIHSVIEEYNKDKTVAKGYEDLIKAYKNLNILDDSDRLLVEEKIFNHSFKIPVLRILLD